MAPVSQDLRKNFSFVGHSCGGNVCNQHQLEASHMCYPILGFMGWKKVAFQHPLNNFSIHVCLPFTLM